MTSSYRRRAHAEALGVYPCLIYRDVRRAITWLQKASDPHGQAPGAGHVDSFGLTRRVFGRSPDRP